LITGRPVKSDARVDVESVDSVRAFIAQERKSAVRERRSSGALAPVRRMSTGMKHAENGNDLFDLNEQDEVWKARDERAAGLFVNDGKGRGSLFNGLERRVDA
jgi:hypothetical protein